MYLSLMLLAMYFCIKQFSFRLKNKEKMTKRLTFVCFQVPLILVICSNVSGTWNSNNNWNNPSSWSSGSSSSIASAPTSPNCKTTIYSFDPKKNNCKYKYECKNECKTVNKQQCSTKQKLTCSTYKKKKCSVIQQTICPGDRQRRNRVKRELKVESFKFL